MSLPRLRTIFLAVAASGSLAACAYDDGYGYGGVSVGYGYPGYYDPYYDGYYGGYGYPSYYGWYDGFYYPGVGIYVYDRSGHRHRWSDRHRRYWQSHRGHGDHRPNWGGYHRPGSGNHGNWNNGGGHWNRPPAQTPSQGQVTPPPRGPSAGSPPVARPRPPARDRDGWFGGRQRPERSTPRARGRDRRD